MRIIVEHDRCEGHGLCELTAPQVYELDEDGMVHVNHAEMPPELETSAEAGAHMCPVAALRILA
jgi:ferredoxin